MIFVQNRLFETYNDRPDSYHCVAPTPVPVIYQNDRAIFTEGGKRMARLIFHVDVNSAFLSWEAVYRLRYMHE